MPKITPFLWFNDQAEEAMKFYVSIFKNSRTGKVTRYGDDIPGPKGKVVSVNFRLDGQDFMALNGGPVFQFTPAISFFISCKDQKEVDWYWDRLLDGGKAEQCGWLTDKFGVSWQIVPELLGKLMNDKDAEKVKKVTAAMLKMVKLDVEGLLQAYRQK